MMNNRGFILDEVKQSLWMETSAKLINDTLSRDLGPAAPEGSRAPLPEYDMAKSLKEIQDGSSFYNFLKQRSQAKLSDLAGTYRFKKGSMSIGSRIHEVHSSSQLRGTSNAFESAEGRSVQDKHRPKPETSILGTTARQNIQIEDAKRNAQTTLELAVHQDLNPRFALVQTSGRRVGVQTASKLFNMQRTPSGHRFRLIKEPLDQPDDPEVLTQMDIDLETPGLKRRQQRPSPLKLQKRPMEPMDNLGDVPSPLKLEPSSPLRKGSEVSGEYFTPFIMRTQSQPLTSSIQQFRATLAQVPTKPSQLNPVAETYHELGEEGALKQSKRNCLDSDPKFLSKPVIPSSDQPLPIAEEPSRKTSLHLQHRGTESMPTSANNSVERACLPSMPSVDVSPLKSQKVSVLKLISMFEKRVQAPRTARKVAEMQKHPQPETEFLISSLTARNPFRLARQLPQPAQQSGRIQIRQRSQYQSDADTSGVAGEQKWSHSTQQRFYSETKDSSNRGADWGRTKISRALEEQMKQAETTGILQQSVSGNLVFSNTSSAKTSLSHVLNRNHNPIVRGRILRNLDRERLSYQKRSKG